MLRQQPLPPDDDLRAKALELHRLLCAEYRCPIGYFRDLDPLSELVGSLLSHRTRNADSGAAFRELRRRFADWEAVRDAPTSEVQEALGRVTWPELKAPRLQAVLRAVTERAGRLDLGFLRGMAPDDARAWLEGLPGIGRKTSAAVLSFSVLRMRALPVDSHHHRVAQRTGLIGLEIAVGPSHAVLEALLPAEWDAQAVYDHHEVMMLHGQQCCFFRNPTCGRCVALGLCPTGQARLAAASEEAVAAPSQEGVAQKGAPARRGGETRHR